MIELSTIKWLIWNQLGLPRVRLGWVDLGLGRRPGRSEQCELKVEGGMTDNEAG